MKKAFTMLEMVFVIVITGLVAVAGSMAIVQIMQNYAIQKEYAKMELDSTSAILQISKYLQNSIWDSIAIKSSGSYTDISNITKSSDGKIDGNTVLAFISKNSEVLNGYFGTYEGINSNLPFFSGFIDLTKSSGTSITTAFSQDKLKNLTSLKNLALYFPFVNQDGNAYNKYYGDKTALFNIAEITTNNTMRLSSAPNKIGDVATIVNTIQVNIQKDNDGNLNIIDYNVSSNPLTIAQGVSSLYIWSEAQSSLLRVRLCFTNKTMDFMPEFCKEGVIMQ